VADAAGIGIAAVERDTGINKETLRVWERRYGFPTPERDASGERLYPPDQVQRLRLVKRLLDAGHRPGHVVTAPLQELVALLAPQEPVPGLEAEAPEVAEALALLQGHHVDGLRRLLSQALLRRGLAAGVIDVLAPLAARVGELALGGELQLFEERLHEEALQRVLRQAMQAMPAPASSDGRPRLLLATLPGETPVPGLLMAEALLSLEGAACLSLGTQMPPAQLAPAAAVHRARAVVLAFGGHLSHRAVHDGLAALRERLPAGVEIWALAAARGLRLPAAPAGVHNVDGLSEIAPAMARLRKLLESPL